MFLRTLLCLIMVLTLAGCVAPPVSLTPKLQQNLDSLQGVIFVPQENLDVDVTPGNPGATGLLGALLVAAIDDSRRSKAQQASAGLVDTLRDFGFRARMARQLDAEFARLGSPRMAGPVWLEATDSESQRRIIFDTSRASAVLFANVSYQLVEAKLVVAVRAVMYPKARGLMQFRSKPNDANPLDDGNAIYRKLFTYRSEIIARDRIGRSLADGMANVAWQLAADMGHVAGSADTQRTAALPPVLPANAVPVRPATVPLAAVPLPSASAALSAALPGSGAIDDAVRYTALSGRWNGSFRCGRWLGTGTATSSDGWTVKAEMSVRGGKATLARGDASYREVLVGDVASDGTLLLQGQGSLLKSPGKPWKAEVSGRFDPSGHGRFQGPALVMGLDGRPLRECTVDLVQTSKA